ncbi:MAG: DUF5132 domain-containing protein [Syntrophobacteraceae bacterium]|nr:DUF5132 domain-containing protein [Syntrophobacteraceae bacterium]
MPLIEDGLKFGTPVLIGIGALLLAPVVLPAAGSVIRPLIKATVKSGLLLAHKGREFVSEAMESLEDITAEVKAELIAERESPTPVAPAEAPQNG